jgi:uncharacterized protein
VKPRGEYLGETWVHPNLQVKRSPIAGDGLFATAPIDADVVVIRLGGRLVNTAELHRLFAEAADDEYIDTFAVGDDTHLVLPNGTTAHYGNHSCEPNTWPVSALELATRSVVAVGDEMTIDYGCISDDATFRMVCTCGSESCRGVVTGDDWRLLELQSRYAGHWPPGLERKIRRVFDRAD